jgi:uncharacterized protein YndB with AHSA1/START domain
MSETPIRWPDRYHPARTPVHVRNERTISASAEAVWECLIRAPEWPDWYPNSRDVRLEHAPALALALGTKFRWRTFGVALESQVLECEAPNRLAWNALGLGVDAYHAWFVEARGPSACHVVTEETQYGTLARLSAVLFPRRMWEGHELWLTRLDARAAQ